MDRFEDNRINEALELLNTVARDNGTELRSAIEHKYTDLTSVVGEFATEMKHRATDTNEAGKQKVVSAAIDVDTRVHRSPWAFIGGVSAVALVSGFLLGISRRT